MNKRYHAGATQTFRPFDCISRRCAWLLMAGLCFALMGSSMASDVPFIENFDYPNGDLDGINGWSATVGSGGAAIVTNGTAALRNASISNVFNEAGGVVTLDFELSPRFAESAPAVPADATFAFYVFTNGMVVAYSNDTAVTLSHDALSEGATNDFQVVIDYVATNWSLSVDGSTIATNFGFYDTVTVASGFTELGVIEGTTNNYSYVDTINIQAPWYTLPFEETFELRDDGSLNGQLGWVATNTVVTNTPVNNGLKAGLLQGDDAQMRHTFDGSETNVWTDLWIQPVFGPDHTSPPPDSSFAFYVNTNGYVVVFTNNVAKQLDVQLESNEWVRFTINSDYVSDTWDLYINEVPIEAGLPFAGGADLDGCTEFGVNGAPLSEAPVDDIAITLDNPLSSYPAASFDPTSASGPESALSVTGTVVLTKSYVDTVTMDVVLLDDGDAVAGEDYTFTHLLQFEESNRS